MAKVVQPKSNVPTFFKPTVESSPAKAETRTVRPQKIESYVDSSSQDYVNFRSAAIVAEGLMKVVDQQQRISLAKQKNLAEQQQVQLQSQARGKLMGIVYESINNYNMSTGDEVAFNASAASEVVRSNVLQYITSPEGALISNDTLKLILGEADKRINAMKPTTNFTVDDGVATVIHQRDGRAEVTKIVVDPDQVRLNSLGAWVETHPNLANEIANDKTLTDEEKVKVADVVTSKLADIESAQLELKFKNAQNPQINLPEGTRRARAQEQYFTNLSKHSQLAINVRMSANPEAMKNTPGAMINMAAQYRADMQNIMFNDTAAADISEMYGVDVYSLVGDNVTKYIEANAQLMEALDPVNVQKLGSEAAAAKAAEASNRLREEDAKFQLQLPPGLRYSIKVAGPMADIYRKMMKSSGQRDPDMRFLGQAMDIASSRFANMGEKMSQLEDNDEPETHQQVQDIMVDFFEDAKAWSNRDYMSSTDVIGFVQTFQMMKESGTFQRLEPENFAKLQQLYNKAKAIPDHTDIFNKIEKGESLSKMQLDAMRDALKGVNSPEGM